MEHKIYNEGPDNDQDKLKTAELKKFSQESQSGPAGERDHEQETMTKASAEIEKRTKRTMLWQNLDYFSASRLVQQADPELSELYCRGYIKD